MIGEALILVGVVFLWFVIIGGLASYMEWRQTRALNARFRENQRLWRHG